MNLCSNLRRNYTITSLKDSQEEIVMLFLRKPVDKWFQSVSCDKFLGKPLKKSQGTLLGEFLKEFEENSLKKCSQNCMDRDAF